MAKSDIPPVPPAGRPTNGPASEEGKAARRKSAASDRDNAPDNLREQDRQGNIKQNTTHPGFQQDR